MVWDRTLLQRFREGDRVALGELFQRYAPLLARALRGAAWNQRGFAVLQSTVELENAVLEVFARAFEPRARAVYDGVRPYEQFLFGIARNYLLEISRARAQSARLDSALEQIQAMDLEAFDKPLEQSIEDREVEVLLGVFRRELSAEDLKLYELRFLEGLGQEQAASTLHLTRIQLRRREFALKKRLLAFLKGRGYLMDLDVRGWSFELRRKTPLSGEPA